MAESKNASGVIIPQVLHEMGATFVYNKSKGTRYIVKSIYIEMQNSDERVNFKAYADFFKKNLTCDPNVTNISELPAMKMNRNH